MTNAKEISSKNWFVTMLLLVAAMVVPSAAWAQSYDENGFGSESDPYQPATLTTDKYDIDGDDTKDEVYEIGNAGQLYWFAGLVNGDASICTGDVTQKTDACAVLTADITVNDGVLNIYGGLNSDTFRSWTPIGTTKSWYSGTFDGNNHTISGLYFNDTSKDFAGLFGFSSGTIQSVGVIDSYFNGYRALGGVCGSNEGGTIQNCYNNSTLIGTQFIGGICGYNNSGQSKILNCYNVGIVGGAASAGGVCGYNTNGTITNCYYLSGTATGGINGEAGSVEGKEETQFGSGEVAYLLAQGCTVGETFYDGSVWGQQLGENEYPVLDSDQKVYYGYEDCTSQIYSNTVLSETPVHHYDNGFCADCDVYQQATLNESGEYEIGNAGQLYWFAGLVNGTLTDGTSQNTTAKGVLTDSIDLSGISNWTPIGNESNKFGGTFDGKNFKVQHLSITQQGSNSGLFGYASGATMQNICIDGNVTLTTTTYTEGYGSIAGCVQKSTISNCHSSVNFTINTEMDASVNCIGHIGGIVGKMNETSSTESNVSGCSYSGTINLNKNKVNVAAGIVGYAIYSNVPITNCSFTGTIHSECEDAIIMGGIFGYTRTSGNVKVTKCLQAGTLEKRGNSSLTGILIGQINTGYGANAITNNYYTSNAFNMIGSTTGTLTTTPATLCTTEQLQSGEICYLLNGSSSDGAWGQQIGTDSYPVPGSDKTVYEVNLLCGGVTNLGKTYANSNEDVTIAHELPETAFFDSEKKIYGKACQREGCGVHLGYFADAAGTIKAKPNAEATAFTVSSYTLEDATAYDSKAEFTVKSLDYKRTFSHNDWVAVYVPFAIDCSELPSDVEMVVINNFHEYEQEDGTYNVVLEVKHKTSGTIPALTPCAMRLKPPFIFNPSPKTGNLTPNVMPMNTALTEAVVVTMNFSNAAFSAAAVNFIDCASMERYYKFTGTLARMEAGSLNDGTDFVLNLGKLNKANEKTSLKAQRWYLSATDRNGNSSASIASLRSIAIEVVGESDVTGIEDIHVITEHEAPVREGIYDLQGRKLNSEPSEGVFIKNGIKYVK